MPVDSSSDMMCHTDCSIRSPLCAPSLHLCIASFCQDVRSFRDFRRKDKLDARFGVEWQTAEVLEVNWDDSWLSGAAGLAIAEVYC